MGSLKNCKLHFSNMDVLKKSGLQKLMMRENTESGSRSCEDRGFENSFPRNSCDLHG